MRWEVSRALMGSLIGTLIGSLNGILTGSLMGTSIGSSTGRSTRTLMKKGEYGDESQKIVRGKGVGKVGMERGGIRKES